MQGGSLLSTVASSVLGASLAIVALSLTASGFGVSYYQGIRFTASSEAKRPIILALLLGFLVIVASLVTAGLSATGWTSETGLIAVLVGDLIGLVIYLIITASVILGD